jgi:hypothetical protein
VKNHDFTPKNHIFSNFRGGAPAAPPLDSPLHYNLNTTCTYMYENLYRHLKVNCILFLSSHWVTFS